jgi:hypothetical protein
MPITIERTADGFPAVRVRHITYALMPARDGTLAVFSRYPAKAPAECSKSDSWFYDKRVDDESEFANHVQDIADHWDEADSLGRTSLQGVIPSIWGPTQTRKEYYPGIENVTCAGHGGFILSPEMNEIVDEAWRSSDASYEEDQAWAIIAFTFPHLFTQRERRFADKIIKNDFPDQWERHTGQKLGPGESLSRDQAAFNLENKNNQIVVSAQTSQKYAGYILCNATEGGDRDAEVTQFLVPRAEYRVEQFGFVIDEAKHIRTGIGSLPSAIDILVDNINVQRAEIERMLESAHQAGDQTIAEQLAEQLADVDQVMPHISKLLSIAPSFDPLPETSASPSREERAMRIVYLESIKMLGEAKSDQVQCRSVSTRIDQWVEVVETLVAKIRALFHLAIDDLDKPITA